MNDDLRLELDLLFGKQRRARDTGDWDLANSLAWDIEVTLMGECEPEIWAALSRIKYENGMVRSGYGEYRSASYEFGYSGVLADKAGDKARSLVGKFRYSLTQYLAGNKPIDDAFAEISDIRRHQIDIEDSIHDGNRAAYENNVFNALKRLFEMSFDLGIDEFVIYCDLLRDHPWILDTNPKKPPMYVLLELQIEARSAMYSEDFDKAVIIFGSYLEVEGTPKADHEWMSAVEKIKRNIGINVEEIARDYRDFGRAMLKSSFDNKEELARRIWTKGLETDDSHGNKIFLEDIEEDLRKLDSNS